MLFCKSAEQLFEGLDEEKTKNFIHMLMELGHESPVEHVYFTFAIEGFPALFWRR
jgi:thymidylate synthase (FAD)